MESRRAKKLGRSMQASTALHAPPPPAALGSAAGAAGFVQSQLVSVFESLRNRRGVHVGGCAFHPGCIYTRHSIVPGRPDLHSRAVAGRRYVAGRSQKPIRLAAAHPVDVMRVRKPLASTRSSGQAGRDRAKYPDPARSLPNARRYSVSAITSVLTASYFSWNYTTN